MNKSEGQTQPSDLNRYVQNQGNMLIILILKCISIQETVQSGNRSGLLTGFFRILENFGKESEHLVVNVKNVVNREAV